jgi:uncharacterized membrane protein
MKELHYRSVIKGTTWRIIGTLDTIFLAWLFTGNIKTALKIGGIEVFTKIFLYFIHERIWLRSGYGRREIIEDDGKIIRKDHHYRSVIKGFSWRFFGSIDTAVIAFFVTGDYTKAFSIGFTEIFTKVFLYYLHERIWQRINLGRRHEYVKKPDGIKDNLNEDNLIPVDQNKS